MIEHHFVLTDDVLNSVPSATDIDLNCVPSATVPDHHMFPCRVLPVDVVSPTADGHLIEGLTIHYVILVSFVPGLPKRIASSGPLVPFRFKGWVHGVGEHCVNHLSKLSERDFDYNLEVSCCRRCALGLALVYSDCYTTGCQFSRLWHHDKHHFAKIVPMTVMGPWFSTSVAYTLVGNIRALSLSFKRPRLEQPLCFHVLVDWFPLDSLNIIAMSDCCHYLGTNASHDCSCLRPLV